MRSPVTHVYSLHLIVTTTKAQLITLAMLERTRPSSLQTPGPLGNRRLSVQNGEIPQNNGQLISGCGLNENYVNLINFLGQKSNSRITRYALNWIREHQRFNNVGGPLMSGPRTTPSTQGGGREGARWSVMWVDPDCVGRVQAPPLSRLSRFQMLAGLLTSLHYFPLMKRTRD